MKARAAGAVMLLLLSFLSTLRNLKVDSRTRNNKKEET